MEMADVRAATRIVTKKMMAMTALSQGSPAPILLKMNGNVSNTRPGPAPGSMPAAKTAGITAKPAMMANRRSETAVPMPEAKMFSSFRM